MKYEGKIEPKNILSYLGRFIPNKAQEIKNNNFDDFINSKSYIPKIILFTNKKKHSTNFQRLSLRFAVSKSFFYYIFF